MRLKLGADRLIQGLEVMILNREPNVSCLLSAALQAALQSGICCPWGSTLWIGAYEAPRVLARTRYMLFLLFLTIKE
jgi:hypothetical protein